MPGAAFARCGLGGERVALTLIAIDHTAATKPVSDLTDFVAEQTCDGAETVDSRRSLAYEFGDDAIVIASPMVSGAHGAKTLFSRAHLVGTTGSSFLRRRRASGYSFPWARADDQALIAKLVNHSGELIRPDGRRPLQLGERYAFVLVCVDNLLDERGRHGWCGWSHWLTPMR